MPTEIAALIATLEELWAEIEQMVREAEPAALTYEPGKGFNSISVIVRHIAGSQQWWIGEVLAGRDVRRDRDAEFRPIDTNTEALARRLSESANLVRDVLQTVTAETLEETRLYRQQPVTVPWILSRVLSHVALHLGHMQIMQQLWELERAKSERTR